jgi:hypothetical protein
MARHELEQRALTEASGAIAAAEENEGYDALVAMIERSIN